VEVASQVEEKESIWRQPIGEILHREITADFLKKELTIPDFLKKEIPGGILDKEIVFRRKRSDDVVEGEDIEQTVCVSCGKETPATVSTCVHCGGHIEATYQRENYLQQLETTREQVGAGEESQSLLDISDEIL
jgi:hypothetical protein